MVLLTSIISTSIILMPFIFLMLVPFRSRLRFNSLATVCIILLLLVSAICITYTFKIIINPPFYYSIIVSIVYMAFAAAVCMYSVRTNMFINLFTLFIIKSYSDSVRLLANTFHMESFIDLKGLPYFIVYDVQIALVTIVTLPIAYILIKRGLIPVIDTTEKLKIWRILWLLPFTSYLVFQLCIHPSYYNSLGSNLESYFILVPYIWFFSCLISYSIILKIVGDIAKSAELRENLHITKLQAAMQEQQYKLLQQNIQETRKFRHDSRHHILMLNQFINSHDIDGLKNYISEYTDTLPIEEVFPFCDNYIVDTIVRYYAQLAEHSQITFHKSLLIPQQLYIMDTDLCIVLGNLLENAMDACCSQTSAERFIYIKIGFTGDNIIAITIKNSHEGSIDCKNNIFISSKHSDEGIGITSVRDIAKKYRGLAKFQYNSNIFEASVLLSPAKIN